MGFPYTLPFGFDGLALAGAQVSTSRNIVRATFTMAPEASSDQGPYDALNPINYHLVGLGAPNVVSVVAAEDDPLSFDLHLSSALNSGTWELDVINIRTPADETLSDPTTAIFVVQVTAADATQGAVSDSSEDVLRKHLNAALSGPFWEAIIASLAAGDHVGRELRQELLSQLYLASATGSYLERRASDQGIQKPANVGMSDPLFREFAIKMTAQKLVSRALLDILEVFYGIDSLRAHVTTTLSEPFTLDDGDTLNFQPDGVTDVLVTFETARFEDIANAKAVEVAAVLSQAMAEQRVKGIAIPYQDPTSGETGVRMYSAGRGTAARLRITGGSAQNKLRFPSVLATNGSDVGIEPGSVWDLTRPEPGVMRFTSVETSPTQDLSSVRIGDYVNVYGSAFHEDNRGSFKITRVDVRWASSVATQFFEIENLAGVVENVTTVSSDDILFFRSRLETANRSYSTLVTEPAPDVVTVTLPATTVAVNRNRTTGAYLHSADQLSIASIERDKNGVVTVETTTAHNLSQGDGIIVDGVEPASDHGTWNLATAGNGSTTTYHSPLSIFAPLPTPPGSNLLYSNLVAMTDGRALIAGGFSGRTVRLLTTISSAEVSGGTQWTYSWTSAPLVPFPCGSVRTQLTLIEDLSQLGNVLITGGYNGSATDDPSNAAYIFNKDTYTWSSVISMGIARSHHTQVSLLDGRIYLCGGFDGTSELKTAQIFSPTVSGGTFVSAASMLFTRVLPNVVTLSTGKVLIIGGYDTYDEVDDAFGSRRSSCELYDPDLDSYTRVGDLASARADCAAVLLPNDQVLVLGGGTNRAEIYDGNTGRWHPAGVSSDSDCRATYLADQGRVLVVSSGTETTTEFFDVATRRWKPNPAKRIGPQLYPRIAQLDNGLVLAVGDFVPITIDVSTVPELYIPGSDVICSHGFNCETRVASVVSPTVFTYETEQGYSSGSGGTVLPTAAEIAGAIPGPYLISSDGVAITDVSSTTVDSLRKGRQYAALNVADARDFPDEPGYIVFAFGQEDQVGPIRYLGLVSNTQLLLDFSQKINADVPVGASVILLEGKGPFVPEHPEDLGCFYATASSSGRIAAQAAIEASMAASVDANILVQYPGDRGLGGEGRGTTGTKISDKVLVWGGDDLDAEIAAALEQ